MPSTCSEPEQNPSRSSGGGLPAPTRIWESLIEVFELLHHPDFQWSALHNNDVKYLQLRIDTRDNRCLVSDRNDQPLTLAKLRELVAKPIIAGMNNNPMIEVIVKPSQD